MKRRSAPERTTRTARPRPQGHVTGYSSKLHAGDGLLIAAHHVCVEELRHGNATLSIDSVRIGVARGATLSIDGEIGIYVSHVASTTTRLVVDAPPNVAIQRVDGVTSVVRQLTQPAQ